MLAEVLLCESDGRVLGDMQFGVLVEVLFCEIDSRVLGGVWFGVLVKVLLCDWHAWGGGGCFARLTAECYGAGAVLRE